MPQIDSVGLILVDFEGTLNQLFTCSIEERQRFIQIAEELIRLGFRLVVCSSLDEKSIQSQILSSLGGEVLSCFAALKPTGADDQTAKFTQIQMYLRQFNAEHQLDINRVACIDDDESMKGFFKIALQMQFPQQKGIVQEKIDRVFIAVKENQFLSQFSSLCPVAEQVVPHKKFTGVISEACAQLGSPQVVPTSSADGLSSPRILLRARSRASNSPVPTTSTLTPAMALVRVGSFGDMERRRASMKRLAAEHEEAPAGVRHSPAPPGSAPDVDDSGSAPPQDQDQYSRHSQCSLM